MNPVIHTPDWVGPAIARPAPSTALGPGSPTARGWRAWWHDFRIASAVRCGVSPRAVLGFMVLAAIVLGCLAVRLALNASAAKPVLVAAPSGLGGPTNPEPTSAGATGSGVPTAQPSQTQGGQILVHVVGKVRRPGVVRLRPGQRVFDAISAAGGVQPPGDLSLINLARVLVDGEQILVPVAGQVPAPVAQGPAGALVQPSQAAVLDLNTATVDTLDDLPGIGPVLADRIVQWRTEHGRFSAVDELGEVSGIGEATLGRLRSKVRV